MDLIRPLSRYVFAPLYALKERSNLFKYVREFDRKQWLPLDALKKRQLAKLRDVLIHSYETVAFYQERFKTVGFDPYRLSNLNQLESIPLLTKKDIIDNTEKMISKNYPVDKLIPACTGGSTGTQLHFYTDRESVNQKNACAWHFNKWANWDIGFPVAALWGNPPKSKALKAKIRSKFLTRFTYLDTIDMTPATMGSFIKKVNRLGNYILYGHSHSQYLLAKFIKDNGIDVNKASGIVATSMMLMQNERDVIEEVFNQAVTDRYGCEEVSLIGAECEKHDGMHLNINHLVIEFIKSDGKPAMAGEAGKIIVTDLTNYGMPFIRYEVGDIGVPSRRKCSCGRDLPLMEHVSGRTADFLCRKDGSQVAGVSLIERWLTNIPGIHQMQIVQNDMEHLIINIVKGKDFNQEKVFEKINDEFRKMFEGSTMEIRFCRKIDQERSGKYRFSICNLNKN